MKHPKHNDTRDPNEQYDMRDYKSAKQLLKMHSTCTVSMTTSTREHVRRLQCKYEMRYTKRDSKQK